MKECSLPHHVSGVCDTCPNKEECGMHIILEMQRVLDAAPKAHSHWEHTQKHLTIGDAID